jgi:hypothetical protein
MNLRQQEDYTRLKRTIYNVVHLNQHDYEIGLKRIQELADRYEQDYGVKFSIVIEPREVVDSLLHKLEDAW